MKKTFKAICAAACAVAAAVCVTSFAACQPDDGKTEGDVPAVKLMATDANGVGALDGVDYYIAAEPAATTKAKAMGLDFSGNLQQLYGAEGGYPQAVIVAKNELVESNPAFLSAFIKEVKVNESWIATSSAETIIQAVSSHLPADTTPTFNAKNLNAQVIANCGIKFVSAAEDKTRVKSFIAEMGEVDATSVGTISDSFFCESLGTASTSSSVNVYMPDGAPALALAKLMSENNTFGQTSVTYNVVPADTIGARVSGENPAADICILPVNAASKLLGSGAKYKMLGTVTNGNLYMLSKGGQAITAENISSLGGKTVAVINLANVPGLTLKIILSKYDIPFETIG